MTGPDIRIPGYRILRELGRGGMATVYLAEQESLGREVALKLLAPRYAQDAGAAERFMREARTAARLVHRHIVGIHEVGIVEGQPYLAMEYLPGNTVPARKLAPAEALQVVREIALALDHAHAQGVVHRDIKPENILRRADGSHALADFGIARTSDAGSAMTQDGVTLGTPHYMSPEQLQGKPLDGRADLYSLGVVLFQLLTGQLPYQGTDGWSIGMQHLSAPLPKLPPELARYQPLVDLLMAKDPNQRPADGAAAAKAIETAQAGITPPATVQLPTGPVSGRRRADDRVHAAREAPPAKPRLALAALVMALLAVGGWAAWTQLRPGDDPAGVATASGATAAQAERSIAVLPLANLSGNPDNEYFSDGLAETTLDMLARVPDLRVIARSSSFAFKGRDQDVREIGKALGAAHLLQGSVQRSGDQVRITVQLVRSRDGANLWSQKYDRKLSDVFQIQDEVATGVVTALQGELARDDRKRLLTPRTDNVAAYQEYLKGNALLRLRKVDDLRAAVGHFERAVALDPNYARAHAAAATALLLVQSHAGPDPVDTRRRDAHIQRALELDPNLGEAHVARAGSLQGLDPAAAEVAFKRALALAPNYATGWQWYAEFVARDLGQPEQALPLLGKAIALDPLAPIMRSEQGNLLLFVGRDREAEAIADALIGRYPDFVPARALKANVMHFRNDLVAFLKAVQRDPRFGSVMGARARLERCRALLSAGAESEAEACAKPLAGNLEHRDRLADLEFQRAVLHADLPGMERATQSRTEPAQWQRALLLRWQGKPEGALELYRSFLPKLFERPLGTPPMTTPYDGTDVATAMLALGQREAAHALLRHTLALAAKRPRSGEFGSAWATVYAHTLLGDPAKACADMEAAAREGFFSFYQALQTDPDLAPLRRQPCFAPAYGRVKAVADGQLAKARTAGLL